MIELFLTIIKGCVILNYYHKELHLRCCRGCISPSAYTRTGILKAVCFPYSSLKHSLPQIWIDGSFIISHSISVRHVGLVATNLPYLTSLISQKYNFIPGMFVTAAMPNKFGNLLPFVHTRLKYNQATRQP